MIKTSMSSLGWVGPNQKLGAYPSIPSMPIIRKAQYPQRCHSYPHESPIILGATSQKPHHTWWLAGIHGYIYIHMYIHTYIHIHMYTCTYYNILCTLSSFKPWYCGVFSSAMAQVLPFGGLHGWNPWACLENLRRKSIGDTSKFKIHNCHKPLIGDTFNPKHFWQNLGMVYYLRLHSVLHSNRMAFLARKSTANRAGHASANFDTGKGQSLLQKLCGLDLWSFEQEEYQLMPLGRSKWGVQHEGQWKAP